jgi:hypothetical protein
MSETAKTAPPPPRPHKFRRDGITRVAVEAAVVFTVSVVVPLPPVLRVILVGSKLQVGRLFVPAGEAVRVHVKFIVPE